MSRKQKFSNEIKIIACEKYYHGEGSFKSIAKEVGCNKSVLRRWYYAYKEHGSSIFNNTDKNKSYDKDFKLSLIDSYQCGNYSMMKFAAKHNIAYSIVQKWISKYNNGVEIKSYDPKGDVYTMKSRKTTFEELLKIVNWVIENNMSYIDAANKFSITYALVYKWTRAYIDKGPEAIEYKYRKQNTTL